MIAGYTEVGGRVLPVIMAEHSRGVTVMVDRHHARRFGIFGDTFVIGTLEQLGAAVARNVADAYRPEGAG